MSVPTPGEAQQQEWEDRAVPMVCSDRDTAGCEAEWFSSVDDGELTDPDCPDCGAEGMATSL